MEDEELTRAIRRDPRLLVRLVVLLVLCLLGIGVGLAWFGGLDIGRFFARGFSDVTESAPPAPATSPSAPSH